MPSPRLKQQFIRLWQSCEGQSQQTTLDDLAIRLNCSRRHMRNLLNAMQQQGWLEWHAEPGRSKRSRLNFLYTGLALQQQRAEDLLEQDRIDQLIQLVGDKNAVRHMLVSRLGRSFRQGRHILRVLYYRSLLNLLPGTPLRRSETHLARQIFSGLTRINEENGEIEADIAHHWQQITPLHWRFFLRPAIHFHHGRELEMADVIATLERLKSQPLYANLQQISSPAPWMLDIYLHQPDCWLAWLLGSVNSMILPKEWPSMPDFSRQPIGTGPYQVVRNQQSQLRIEAFDDYFGYRALIDEVNIWVLPEISEELVYSGVKLQSGSVGEKSEESRLEEGCYFLLFDQRSEQGRDEQVRRWVNMICNPVALLNQASIGYQRYWFPAYGLLPRWHHRRDLTVVAKPAGLTSLTLTWYHDHIEHQGIADALRPLLAAQGVTLKARQVDYATWHRGDADSDIWLGSANFTLPLAFSLFALLYEIPLMHHCLTTDWEKDAQRWRQQTLSLADWSKRLIDSHTLHPLFHHWLLLEGERSMQGVRMNTLGWFDFKSAWFAPSAT
ncbi:HTH-type transcriptional regulator SgrR [Erwinia psidii]|uniref:HTH-type transcriptional regulator SgrR n=1 Tax=Erwinia psidii TaxID=69224 RepID=A0A3N6SDX2_9GAMM|nr:HTH-type transcriptional regulator SgrR [Erwinia psidii]MCX8957542.1 HTH-type transcriptional regulator SgrR [Erwinia psidii]MCX8960596.1 HTH-type transcriptional regulator SgrR [Erwinia psidii]MCX8964159.1 HTH-type transcriptional regulator SgrR [Erwinia psidii]RQM39640.1 HTH-type transcriptional regulator SgrR [Erwinia psidii]